MKLCYFVASNNTLQLLYIYKFSLRENLFIFVYEIPKWNVWHLGYRYARIIYSYDLRQLAGFKLNVFAVALIEAFYFATKASRLFSIREEYTFFSSALN